MPEHDLSLYQRLNARLDRLPMHMPGHKRNTALAQYLAGLGAALDITEITGFDNLHDAQGPLKASMELAAAVFGAAHTIYSVNGSTAGILAGIGALTRRGDKVLVARNCHMSVINAIRLHALRPVFLQPPVVKEWSIFGSLATETVEEALGAHPDARLLVLTSPTYEGVISDVAGICAVAHARGIPVLVDEAHGAHLDLSPHFLGGAVKAGADIVVQSLHKTLPSLTQTAVIHVADADVAREVTHQMRMFETSSPSYLLLASLDSCVRLLEKDGKELMAQWHDAIQTFHAAGSGLRALRLLGVPDKPAGIHALDPSKLLILTSPAGLSGHMLAQRLRDMHAIECEMALPQALLAMTGMGDTRTTLLKLAGALCAEDADTPQARASLPIAWPVPETVLPMDEALAMPFSRVPLASAVGCVSGEVVTLYPPGAPLLVPGEQITEAVIEMLRQAQADRATVFFERGGMQGIATLDTGA